MLHDRLPAATGEMVGQLRKWFSEAEDAYYCQPCCHSPGSVRGWRDRQSPNVKLRDMNVQVSATDGREIEVVAAGLPIHHGAQLAVHITHRSAVISVAAPRATAATVNGATLSQGRRDKEAKYAELVASERC